MRDSSMYILREKNKEKHEKHGLDIECINKAFKVRFENFFIPIYARTGIWLLEKNKKRRPWGKERTDS